MTSEADSAGAPSEYPVVPWEELPEEVRERWHGLITKISLPPLVFDAGFSREEFDAMEPAELAAKVSTDPLLAGKVLAVANSAAMGLSTPITSLERAVVYLGFNLVQSIMVAYYLEHLFIKWPGFPRAHFDYVRRWSAASCVVAYNIGAGARLSDPATLGTATLLSRLGSLLLGMTRPLPGEEYRQAPNEVARLKLEAERWCVSSPVLSARLVKHWGLPEPLPTLLERSWEPFFMLTPEGQFERFLVVIATSLTVASGYLTTGKPDALTVLDRQCYRMLRENLEEQLLYEAAIGSCAGVRLLKELGGLDAMY